MWRNIAISLIDLKTKIHLEYDHTMAGVSWLTTKQHHERRRMGNHAVTLRVAPFLRIECRFWLTDDGWNGRCEQPPIIVQAGSFEHAKSAMEFALGKCIESLLRQLKEATTEHAA